MSSNYSNNLAAIKQQAVAFLQQGNYLGAKELLDPLAHTNRMDAESYSLLGSIHDQIGDLEEAARYFQESVKLQPNTPQVHYGLGMVLAKMGRFPEAENCFHTVLQFDPANLPAILGLAITEISQNKLSEAEVHFGQVLSRDNKNLKALIGMGRVYQALNKPDFAINYYQNALEINPNIPPALHHLGSIYTNKGQCDLGEKFYKKALRLDPKNIQILIEMGQLYMLTNNVDKAKSSFREALALQPDNLDVITAEAQLYEQTGDIKSAYDLIMPYIEKGVKHIDMGILFSKICRHFERCEEAVSYLEEVLEYTKKSAIRNNKIYFALGKLYDRLEDYDKAFQCFQAGNSNKPDTFNRLEHQACIDTLIKRCDWNFFVMSPRSTQKSERPVFIVGMPRSGTTLTEQILCSHPNVYGAGEISTFPDIIRNLSDYLGAAAIYPDSLENLSVEILNKLSATYLEEISKLDNKASRVIDKTLVNYLYLGLISMMFPNSRVIHCKRDPRDTCLSIYFQSFDESHNYASNLEYLGYYYNEYQRVMDHWKSLIKIPVYEVQYEELVKNQEKISRELIDFIGLDWDDRVLEFYKAKRSVATASYDQVRQKMYTKSTERWKNYEKHIGPLTDALDQHL